MRLSITCSSGSRLGPWLMIDRGAYLGLYSCSKWSLPPGCAIGITEPGLVPECMDPRDYFVQHQTRRAFFKNTGLAAGRIGLASLMFPGLFRAVAGTTRSPHAHPGLPGLPHFPPKARRLIYLFMN